ncbi:MAG TPA: hypothetical protein VIG06_24120 [Kofleriaceae bacterium]|jgi:hypothetical protein
MGRRLLAAVALAIGLASLASPAGAEPVRGALDPTHAVWAPAQRPVSGTLPTLEDMQAAPTWSFRLAEKMTLAGDELGLHLRAITFNSIDMDFDGHKRIAHLRMQAGEAKKVALGIDSDVAFKSGYARVAATVKFGVAGKTWQVELPEFDMVPRSYDGHKYVELRLPVIDFRF